MLNFKKQAFTHKKLVLKALEESENSRNSDWELLFKALEMKGIPLSNNLKIEIGMSGINIHTLVRERRRIQKSGLYLPTNPNVLKKRKLLESEYKEHYTKLWDTKIPE